MREIFRAIREFVRKADMVLLALCVTATVFGIVVISSATNYIGNARYIRTQTLALILGIIVYVLLTLIDVDIIAERRELLLIFSVLFIGMLKIWGSERGGNKSWLDFPFLPFNIQPAEICKIFYILILAKVISVEENKISTPLTVMKLAGITMLLAGEIILVSDDLGVALCYVFIFIIMAYVGGVNFMWFLAGLGAVAVASPFLWSRMRDDQRNRILVIFDQTIDPKAQGVRYQMNRSIRALQNGGITGQGLYHGSMIQSNSLPEQHNDLIFSSIGEELGLLGCLAVLILLTAIIIRIIHVGIRSGNNMNRLICVGIAGMLASQTIINVGVCLGIFPVVGLTLPFFSYGGSSIVTMFLAMGIVSGIHMRPAPDISAMYIRPKLNEHRLGSESCPALFLLFRQCLPRVLFVFAVRGGKIKPLHILQRITNTTSVIKQAGGYHFETPLSPWAKTRRPDAGSFHVCVNCFCSGSSRRLAGWTGAQRGGLFRERGA